METMGFCLPSTGFYTRHRVDVKPCLLEASPVHCGGLEHPFLRVAPLQNELAPKSF